MSKLSNSTLVHALFTLELEFSEKLKVSGNLSPDVGQIFMAALGGILEKDFLDSLLQTDFEEKDSDDSARFVASLSNMFETIKYLVVIGVVTFLCGNSILVKIAEKRKQN